ncbi:MAG: efflux RND transporter periplasmic adaptor subunit [Pseudomonadota bacterium]
MTDMSRVAKEAQPGPSLSQALATTFDASSDDAGFARRVTHLAVSLTNGPVAYLIAGDTVLGGTSNARPPAQVLDLAAGPMDGTARAEGAFAGVAMALPSGQAAVLVLQLPPGGTVAGALALERLTNLSALAGVSFNHPEIAAHRALFEAIADRAVDLEPVAEALQRLTDADYVALGRLSGDSVSDLAISGQTPQAKRAALPASLRAEMAEIASRGDSGPDRVIARGPGGVFVVRIVEARRNAALAPMVVQLLSVGDGAHRAGTRRGLARLRRFAVGLVAAMLLAFVPLPEGRRISAEVSSVSERVVTAPYAGALAEIAVRENDSVTAGETVLARLDDALITQELIAAQADHAKALLERESARVGRNASELRNAELEAERLRSQIELLEARRDSAVIRAPISGLVVGDGLSALQGATVRQGETLMRVLDPSDLRLTLEVLDEDVADLAVGEAGVFRPDFDPSLTYEAQIASVSPALQEGREIAVFTGRAIFQDDTPHLSPGLRGVVSVDRAWTPAWRVVWTGLRDWVLLRVWI